MSRSRQPLRVPAGDGVGGPEIGPSPTVRKMEAAATERDRLASLFGALVSSADAASGFHNEKAIRTAILAARLAVAHGLPHHAAGDAYYLALVRFLGCTAFAPEAARYGGGDDISVGTVMGLADPDEPFQLMRDVFSGVGKHAPLPRRVRGLATLLSDRSAPQQHAAAECDVGASLARAVGMPASVVAAVDDLFERCDGKGHPNRKTGDGIALLARIVAVADVLELCHARLGLEVTVATARRRAGGRFDPAVVETFCTAAGDLLGDLNETSVWDTFLDAEPPPHQHVTPAVIDRYAEAFARAVDLKSVWTPAHSHTVGVLAGEAAAGAGHDAATVTAVRRAGWLHDLGRVAIPNLVWDKPGPFNAAEWEQARLHAHLTERLLARSPVTVRLAAIAAGVHERCDGSGYPKSTRGGEIEGLARLLAVCDVYAALREDRPHRPAMDADSAATVLAADAKAGRLDPSSVEVVLDLAGTPTRVDAERPAGLTEREVDVLRLLAGGATNKAIAGRLEISPRTVQHHVAHIYDKVGVTSRAGAALFAAEQHLTGPGHPRRSVDGA